MVPVDAYTRNRVCTGYEAVIPHLCTSEFIVKAEHVGKIEEIDEKQQLIKVRYRDGSIGVYQYGEVTGHTPDNSYNHVLVLMPGIKVGKIVKPGEILAYHNAFFQLDPLTGQPVWCHGVTCRVAVTLSDATLEDSNIITNDFAAKFNFSPVYEVVSVVDTEMEMKEYLKPGEFVEYDSHLMTTAYSLDESLGKVDVLFEELQQTRYRAKHKGIIKSIKIYSSTDELKPSMMQFVRVATADARKRASFAKGTMDQGKFTPVILVPVGTRIAGKTLGENDMIVVHEIKADQPLGVGDKICLDSALKTVVGEVVPMITDEDGEPLDCKFSALSVFARIVLSPFIQGIMNTIVIDGEKKLVAMLDEE